MRRGAGSEGRGRAVLVAASLAFSLVAAEACLALLGWPDDQAPPRKPPQFQFLESGAARRSPGYVNRRSAELRFVYPSNPRGVFGPGNEVLHHTNSSGFRGPEFPAPVPGALRLAFLGDSFTFGEGVGDADTFAERAAAALRGLLGDRRVDPLNLGVGGYDTEQEVALWEVLAPELEPGALVLGYAMNDVRPPLFVWDEEAGRPRRRPGAGRAPGEAPRGFFALRTVQLVLRAWRGPRQTAATLAEYRALYARESPRWQATRRALQRLGSSCRRHGLDCSALLFPVLVDLDDYPLAAEHERVRRALAAAGFRVLDLLPELRQRDARELWVHPGDHHPNEEVHRLAGERVAQAVAAACGAPTACRYSASPGPGAGDAGSAGLRR